MAAFSQTLRGPAADAQVAELQNRNVRKELEDRPQEDVEPGRSPTGPSIGSERQMLDEHDRDFEVVVTAWRRRRSRVDFPVIVLVSCAFEWSGGERM